MTINQTIDKILLGIQNTSIGSVDKICSELRAAIEFRWDSMQCSPAKAISDLQSVKDELRDHDDLYQDLISWVDKKIGDLR